MGRKWRKGKRERGLEGRERVGRGPLLLWILDTPLVNV